MNKKLIFIIVIALIVGASVLFYTKSNPGPSTLNLQYNEPVPGFSDAKSLTSSDTVVKITNSGFEPSSINIRKGQRITWVNDLSGPAWPASNPHPSHTDYPGFDVKLPMNQGQAWSFVFDKVGDWEYHNHFDPTRRGVVRVTE
ncbi:MAG TPA: hypothetical protein VJG67_01025 [Candidatus Paceibacterota bacterium]